MGVGNQRVVVREVALPYLPEKELRASLGFQVQEFIPMSVDEAVLDFDPLGEFEQEGRRMLRILLVAAQRQMVDSSSRPRRRRSSSPSASIWCRSRSCARSAAPASAWTSRKRATRRSSTSAPTSRTSRARPRHARFVRILPSGGRDVTLAIARATLASVEDEVGRSGLKTRRGGASRGADRVEERREPGRRVAMERGASFVDEIRSSLEFYTAQAQGARIGRVLVTGGGSKLDGFLDLLRERIPVEVRAGQVFLNARPQLSLGEEALAEAEPVLAVAVGLAIPGRDA